MAKCNRQSSIVVKNGSTVLDAAVRVLRTASESMGPTEIAETGIQRGILRRPRGRTLGYVAQTIQTKLQANATESNSRRRRVYRPTYGKYRARTKVS